MRSSARDDEGEYFARGVYGRHIYINSNKGVVIAAKVSGE